MRKNVRFFLVSSHKHRCRVAGVALWLLRLLLDAEHIELQRISDLLDSIDPYDRNGRARREYAVAEDECINCECALGFLECAVEDMKCAY